MSTTARVLAAPMIHRLSGVIMASLFALFAYAHLVKFREGGGIELLLFVAAESVLATLFVLRTRPKSFATHPLDWVVASLGTFLPMLLRPASQPMLHGAEWAIAFGAMLQLLGALSLNRSFAIVPALREVKTSGMYRWVRHPIYASYFVSLSAYLAGNASAANAIVCLATFALLIWRVRLEERHLVQDAAYRAYMARVRWRLFPLLY